MNTVFIKAPVKIENGISTNSFMMNNYQRMEPYSVIYADDQQAGRGRYERKWHSVSGKDLTFSILIPLDKKAVAVWQNITQVASISIAEVLGEFGIYAMIKWPNDILVNNKKICGMLNEVVSLEEKNFAVLGIGLNVNSDANDLAIIDQLATSVFCECGKVINLIELLTKISQLCCERIIMLQQNGFLPFVNELRTRLAWTDRELTIEDCGRKISGRIDGIRDDGTLLFKTLDGEIINCNSGEIRFIRD